MTLRFPAFIALSLLVSLSAVRASDVGQEYAQVRKIAARDEKVRDAFARANERMDARIVSLDPALAGYVRTHPSGSSEPALREAAPRQPFRPAPVKAPAARPGTTHVVTAGETLSSIASQYKVPVAKLQAVNHIDDARKLRVGWTLAIPATP